MGRQAEDREAAFSHLITSLPTRAADMHGPTLSIFKCFGSKIHQNQEARKSVVSWVASMRNEVTKSAGLRTRTSAADPLLNTRNNEQTVHSWQTTAYT